ncbi:MAG: TPM domain-containing protein [Cytophagaceae bacterium]|nr:TPM domain-containing protein [Cytophagaceae bacterium]
MIGKLFRFNLVLFCFSFLLFSSYANYPNRFSTVSHINDYAGLLSGKEKSHLESVCNRFLDTTGNELVILTVNDIKGHNVQAYADSVVNQWTKSSKQLDMHGYWVLILISKYSREYAISVGSRLERKLDKVALTRIEQSYLKPYFKKNHFEAGLVTSINAMESVVNGHKTVDDLEKTPYGFVLILLCITFIFYMFLIPLFQYQVFKHNNLGSKPVNFLTGIMIAYGKSFIAHRSYDDFAHNVGIFKTSIPYKNGGSGVVGKW